MNIGDLFFSFRGDSKQLEIDAKKSGQKAGQSIGQQMTQALKTGDWGSFLKAGLGLGAGLAVFGAAKNALGGVADAVGDMIGAASDLEESQSKVNQVFTESADVIHKWASDSAQSFGLSEQAALEAAGTFGNFIQALGSTEDEANSMSRRLVELAADLASFNNMEVDDVLTSLRSGLAGEAEPMRRLGADISAARVQALLLDNGFEMVNKTFTEAQKVQGRYLAILEDTVKAQGDFDRTSDGMANKQRILNAEIENMKAAIGSLLIGPATDFLSFLVDIIDMSPKASEATKAIVERMRELGEEAEKTADKVEDLDDAWRPLSEFDVQPFVRFGFATKDLVPELIAAANASRISVRDLHYMLEATGNSREAVEDLIVALREAQSAYDPLSSVTVRAADATKEMSEAAIGAQPSILGMSKSVLGHSDALQELAEQYRAALSRMRDFKDNASAIAKSRSLGKINDDLRKQRKLLRDAAEAGNLRGFAAATAAIEQLKSERELRRQGRQALREYRDNTTGQVKAQGKVIKKVEETEAAIKELGEQRAHPSVTLQGYQLTQQRLDTLRDKLAALRDQAGVTYDPLTGRIKTTAPRRAAGGPVVGRLPYVVGERGPELFVPDRSGRIVSNADVQQAVAGGGGATVNAQIYGLPMQASTPRETVAEIRRAASMGIIRPQPRGFQPA